jgi:hypothetical protein
MKHGDTRSRPTLAACTLAIAGLATTACAAVSEHTDTGERLPVYSVTYFTDGSVEVKDYDGKAIEPAQEVRLPYAPEGGIKAIQHIRTEAAITIHGSHYVLKQIGSKLYKIYCPHAADGTPLSC